MRSRNRKTSSGGYTLFELVVVLAIMSVGAGVTVPRYLNSLNVYRAELGARRVAGDLRLARAQAMANSANQSVSFDATTASYTLPSVVSLDRRTTSYTVHLSADPYRCTIASANFNGGAIVTFDAYGSADSSGQIIVQCGDIQRAVNLEASSGKATVP